jgi:hypothetical protein
MRHIAYFSAFLSVMSAGIATFGAWNVLPSRINSSELDAAQQPDSKRLEELHGMIKNEIGTPSANEPSQCKLIGFGSKPCGGPGSYLVYSTAKTNESRLKQLVSEFNQLAKKINDERGLFSDCAVTPKPKVEFVDGVCTAKRR